MKTKPTSSSRRQPHRAVKGNSSSPAELLPSPNLRRTKAGIAKSQGQVKGNTKTKKGGQWLKRKLEKKVAAIDPTVALLEQSALLGITADPPHLSPTALKSPRSTPGKRGRWRKSKKEKKYMDDFLSPDDEKEDDQDEDQSLKRSLRWVPDMEHRPRISRKPANVPYQLWMAYCSLDDYIYRYSLTKEETLAHPLLDEVYRFELGGPQPVPPPGFQWNDDKLLAPTSEVPMNDD
ncbi:hypothetical protein F5B20DRAFT_595595 [Whalleya microplaca]|nr:hypothetical protein F5B20DRAFT_595595 [Whalleya microplaca]